jgi:zona occludens toxin (predicted ATPase)
MIWTLKHHNTRISEVFFSVSSESLAVVILENNAMIWRNKACGFSAVDSNACYMKQAKDGPARKD